MPNPAKIRKAAMLRHSGKTFAEIAEAVGVKSPTTVFRWEQTQVWQDEIRALEEIDKRQTADEYTETVNRTRLKIETAGNASFDISIRLLAKLKRLVDKVDVEELKGAKEQLQAMQTLVNTFEKLSSGGKTMIFEGSGIEELARQLERLQ